MRNHEIRVRALKARDIPFVADYWLHAEPDFLKAMGADPSKIPSRDYFYSMLNKQISDPDKEKTSLAMILEVDGLPEGHCNVNAIEFGEEAYMHLHLWNFYSRGQGWGEYMVRNSLHAFFTKLNLKRIYSQPYAENPAPCKTLEKVGFDFIEQKRCIPGALNFEQEVKLYCLSREQWEVLRDGE